MATRFYSSIATEKTVATTALTNLSTAVTLSDKTGLPSVPFTLVLDPDTASEEIVTCTVNTSGNTYTITRGEESTVATDHNIGAKCRHMITARDLTATQTHYDATTAHGVTGNVVGTGGTQTLTNKTLTSPALNTPTINNATIASPSISNATLTGTLALPSGSVTSTMITDGTILNADINASAAIAATKISGTAVTLAGAEALTNKTLTSPIVTGGTLNGGAALTVDSTELNRLDGVTATTAELNVLAGIPATLTSTELGYVDGVTSSIQTQINNSTPVGTMVMFATNTAPTGWLTCDGSQQLVATYPALDTLLGTTYGIRTNGSGVAGTTHFRLPDLRGRAPIGAGTGRNVADSANLTARTLGKFSDAETQVLTEANMPSHNHTTAFGRRTTTAETHDHEGFSAGDFSAPPDDRTGATESTLTLNKNTDNTGSGTAHNNMQPSTVVNFIIKF